MNLYLINNLKRTIEYDSYDGHVIRCATPERAVEMAKDQAADEGSNAWDIDHVELLASDVEGEEDIILSSFNAG